MTIPIKKGHLGEFVYFVLMPFFVYFVFPRNSLSSGLAQNNIKKVRSQGYNVEM